MARGKRNLRRKTRKTEKASAKKEEEEKAEDVKEEEGKEEEVKQETEGKDKNEQEPLEKGRNDNKDNDKDDEEKEKEEENKEEGTKEEEEKSGSKANTNDEAGGALFSMNDVDEFAEEEDEGKNAEEAGEKDEEEKGVENKEEEEKNEEATNGEKRAANDSNDSEHVSKKAAVETEDVEMSNKPEVETENSTPVEGRKPPAHALPEITREDKTLEEVLEMMDDEDFTPIIPDAVTDYYLAKNGFATSNRKIKRLLALATQKFVSDIATDAFEYSRIRSASAVYNSSNPQVRARALMMATAMNSQGKNESSNGENGGESSGNGLGAGLSQQGHNEKVTLTMEDLSSALDEYGLNVNRPQFYR